MIVFGEAHLRRILTHEGREGSQVKIRRKSPPRMAEIYEKRILVLRPSCPCRKLGPHILMMQSAQDGAAEYAANATEPVPGAP